MKELKISEMLESQYKLWEMHKDSWEPMEPKQARNSLLYMIEEIGEVISVIKKQGEDEIMNNSGVREHFVVELADVFMYYMDVMNRFKITAVELTDAYRKKNEYNLTRDYVSDNIKIKEKMEKEWK